MTDQGRAARGTRELPDDGFEPTDHRLAVAALAIRTGNVEVLSLDVFDTLLWRVVPVPQDAFVLLGMRLQHKGWLRPHLDPHVFALLRARAEHIARERCALSRGTYEVTLEEIYSVLGPGAAPGLPADELVREEVELEREVTVPDLDIVLLAQDALKRDIKLVLVSNTYLSENHIRTLLARPPLTSLFVSQVFVSSAHGRHKADGLFEVMLATLKIPPSTVLHIGDDLDADITPARELGMATCHVARSTPALESVLRRDGRFITQRGDYGTTSLRCKVAARAERKVLPEVQRPFWDYGAVVLGPAFSGFSEWVHRRAAELEIDRVHCLMREGTFLTELLEEAGALVEAPVDASPLWMSRQVAWRASIVNGSREELAEALHRMRSPTLREFCTAVGLELGQLPEFRNRASSRLDEPGLREHFFDYIDERPEIQGTIRMGSAILRDRLATYLDRTIDLGSERVMIVDLGWAGSIQLYLQQVLAAVGSQTRLSGLYLLTNNRILDRMIDGVDAEGYLGTALVPGPLTSWLQRTPEILEQVLLADCGSLIDMDSVGHPVLDGSVPHPRQRAEKAAVQAGILAYQRERGRYLRAVPAISLRYDGEEVELMRRTLAFSVARPTREEAALFAPWHHDDNFGTDSSSSIISDHLRRAVPYLTPGQLLELPSSDAYWPAGAAALWSPELAQAVSAIAEDRIDPAAFERVQPQVVVEFFVDEGSGFEVQRTEPLRTNVRGLSYVRARLDGDGIRSIRVDPAASPGFLRLDWLRLRCSIIGVAEPVELLFDDHATFATLDVVGCLDLGNGAFIAVTGDPHIVCHVDQRVGGSVYAIEVDLAFAFVGTPVDAAALETQPPAPPLPPSTIAGRLADEWRSGGPAAIASGLRRWVRRRMSARP